jgi:predicted TIM-barrel fold metal-dependent hydrolase
MPLQDYMKLVSVDDHVMEPPDLWTARLPHRDADAGPRVLEDPDGTQYWTYEGREYRQFLAMIGVAAGFRREQYGLNVVRYDQMATGAWDVAARLDAMDEAGVEAELCFPSIPKFAGTLFLDGQDKDLALRCVRVWNDYILDEWCAYAPERFIPACIVPLWDPNLAAAEVERVATKGARTISFPENPVPLGLPSFYGGHWDPLFAALDATGLPLSTHIGTSGQLTTTGDDAPWLVSISMMWVNSAAAALDYVFSGVLQRFPNVKVVLSEGGIGWMPFLIDRVAYTWERQKYWAAHLDDLAIDPVRLFHDRIYGCFIDDEVGLALRDRIGIGNLMWEQDYPHSDTLYPDSRKRAAEMMSVLSDDEAHKIAELNARRVYDFHPSLAGMPG